MFKGLLTILGISTAVGVTSSKSETSKYLRERNKMFDDIDEEVERYRLEEGVPHRGKIYMNIVQKSPNSINLTLTKMKILGEDINHTEYDDITEALDALLKLKEYYEKTGLVVHTRVNV